MTPHQKTFCIQTLGCKLNYSESSTLSRQLKNHGLIPTDDNRKADVFILNTCSVTNNADKECQQIIKKVHHDNPDTAIIVVGCYAQLKPHDIASLPGVDAVLGASEKFNLVAHIDALNTTTQGLVHGCAIQDVDDFKSAFSYQDRTRAFLKVQDGCDYNCSYCTIPLARGKSRSDSLNNILHQLNILEQQGVQEVVLTGVNLGDYQHNGHHFIDLIQRIEKASSIQRFRISSIEPNLLTREIIQCVAQSKKIMPHFHIPLQSGSNDILKKMRRRYQRELYQDKIELIKNLIPDCGIGVDVIVGFPSETDALFEETAQFIRSLPVSYLHVFTYSERDNTMATTITPAIPIDIRRQRNRILRNLSMQKSQEFYNTQINRKRPVLFEAEDKDNMIEGYTDNYIKVKTFYHRNLVNKIVEWDIV